MSTDDNAVSVCANCGKEGDDINNICNKCKQVKYCNAVCKKKHRHKHKKDCEEYIRLATEKHNEELRLAAEQATKLHDEKLFEQPPPAEDCPICFISLPTLMTGSKYMSCCGKTICSGCSHAPVYDSQGNEVDNKKCPFCRTPPPASNEDNVERLKVRMETEDPEAVYAIGLYYSRGLRGVKQDHTRAFELWHQAAELGCSEAYCNIGYAYDHGEGVEVDYKKAVHYYELAAMAGDVESRHNLGNNEVRAGNFDRALKHYMIAASAGLSDSLEMIKQMYKNGDATKDDYMTALRLYQEYLVGIKSRQRDEAAEFDERNRYY